MKYSSTPKLVSVAMTGLFVSAAILLSTTPVQGADRLWTDGTASYNNPANWTGGVVPGAADNAINDNGTNHIVQINIGDPDWPLGQLGAGNAAAGAFEQNGHNLTLSATPKALRLGIQSGSEGVYTLNNGTLNYGGGELNVGQLGKGTFNLNGGVINGSGAFAVNVGSSLNAVTATMGEVGS